MPLPELSGYSRKGLIGKIWLHLCRLISRILEFGPSRLPNVFSLLNIKFKIFSRIIKKDVKEMKRIQIEKKEVKSFFPDDMGL